MSLLLALIKPKASAHTENTTDCHAMKTSCWIFKEMQPALMYVAYVSRLNNLVYNLVQLESTLVCIIELKPNVTIKEQ